MPRALSPIPQTTPIVDQARSITDFFRYRWQELIDGFGSAPLAGSINASGQTAALATATVVTTTSAGLYRLNYTLVKTVADGVSSSLQVTASWVSGGLTLTHTFSALTTDSIGAEQGAVYPMACDAASTITVAIAYASNTANKMTYAYVAAAERLV
jgi:hypothetical protein